jgi:hypothetical protein
MARTASDNPDVHRELIVQDPPQTGRDVANFQRNIQVRLKSRGLGDDVPVPTHGKFTHATWVAAVEAGYFLGLLATTYLATDKGRGLSTEGAQTIIRDPEKRTDDQLDRAKERKAQLDRGPRYYDDLARQAGIPNGKGAQAAMDWAGKQLGVKESPPGSNWGPKVSDWIRATGYTSPVPWCFAAGTLVNTPAGLRRIEEIRVGDAVMDAHGGIAIVGAAHARQATDRFRLTAHGIDSTIVSGEHPYIARRCLTRAGRKQEFGEPQWVEASDLGRGDLIAQPLLGGAMPMDEARAHLIGRWLADGWAVARRARKGRQARHEYFLCGSHGERDALVATLDAAGLGYSERTYPTVVQFALRVDATPLLAGCGSGARSKRLPRNALMWHESARRALMEGYLAGDGCVYRGITKANSVSRELTLGMAQIARSVGHVVTMRAQVRAEQAVIAGRTINQATRYEMVFQADGIGEGRRQYLAGVDEHVWVPVRGVEQVEPGIVHNLTVSGESTFIADGYAVHNCGCFCNAAVMAGGVPSGAGWIGYTPAIVQRAKRGIGGWSWHSSGEFGDLVLFDTPGGDIAVHVGLVRSRINATSYKTREGNTGSSNADGGQVQDRERSTQGSFRIIGFARPPWPS